MKNFIDHSKTDTKHIIKYFVRDPENKYYYLQSIKSIPLSDMTEDAIILDLMLEAFENNLDLKA